MSKRDYAGNPVDRLPTQQTIYSKNLVVGDEPCSFVEVRDVLYGCASSAKLWPKLIDIAKSLKIPTDSVISLETRIPTKVITYPGALVEILEAWRGKLSAEAKLQTLINVLERNSLADCADALRIHFNEFDDAYVVSTLQKLKSTAAMSSTWENLPDDLKHWMNRKPVKFQGNEKKLEELTALIATPVDEKILDELGERKSPCIVHDTVPAQLEYYIHRNVRSRNILKLDVLKDKCNDVFVIEGIERHKLSSLVPRGESTDVSGNQLVQLTMRFILLQHNQDFEKISKLATTGVHWIKFKNERFEHVKSSGSMETLQNHVDGNQDTFSEEELASRHERVVVIADSPGLGKTSLLANIAHQIMSDNPTMLVRFIVMKDFVDNLNNKEINVHSIVKQIAEQSSDYKFGKKFVEHVLKTRECVLLFDGLDEVLLNQLSTAKKILQEVATLPSAKVYLATRPHLRDEIENQLHVLAYNMNPFEESNQINFLMRFWKNKGAIGNDSLTKFTQDCVNQLTISSKMTDGERNIAGIPLQCRMIAETYEEQAIRCSNLTSNDAEPIIINSVFEVYEKHMNMRFEKVKSNQYDNMRKIHVLLALQLLFPEHSSEFELLKSSGIPLNELCGLGIVEATDSNNIRFVHRTFAEFLVAMLAHQIIINASHPDMLLSTIFKLSPKKVTLYAPSILTKVELKSFQFNFPVICYFVNALLKSQPPNNLPFDYHEEALPYYHASAFHNYDAIPFIVSRLVQSATKTNSVKTYEELKRDVLYVAALHSGLELIKMFCSAIGITQIQVLKIRDTYRFSPFTLTPLHVAVRRGHYTLVEYLLNKFEDNLANLPYLIHFCIKESTKNTQVIVKEIIKLLSKINHDWIDEQLIDQSTPLMQWYVHPQLLQCLIEEGANLDACDDEDGNTVLHKITERNFLTGEEYDMILNCLIQHGFKYINKPAGYFKVTPLHYAVWLVELLSKTLDCFLSKGADFNAVNGIGDSVLFYAILGKRSSDLMSMLINRGSNTNHRNDRGRNVLHISVEGRNLKALEYFLNTHNINVNHQDKYGDTPLHLAVIGLDYEDREPMQLLLMKLGANVNAVNKLNRTPFLESFQHEYGRGLSLTVIKEMETRGLHITKPVASEALTNAFLKIEARDSYLYIYTPLESLVYLMNKGGQLKWKSWIFTFSKNFWKWKEVEDSMQNIIKYTRITTDLLTQAHTHGILTQQQIIQLQELEDSVKSKRFYEMVRDKPGSFERVYIILRSEQQTEAVEELRWCLRDWNKSNQKENIVECLNTLCNLDQFGLANYRKLIVVVLNKIPDVEVKEVTNIDKEEEEKQQKLANLVVGDPNCTYNEVCDTLSKSKAAKKLWKILMDVASDLDIPCEDEIAIERGLKNDTKTSSSALREILETWRGKHSKNAKLLTLVQVLEKRDLSGCADALVDKFTSK